MSRGRLFLLSGLKNDVGDRSVGTARSWKSIVTFIFGTPDDDDDDDETPSTEQKETRTLRHDHDLLQKKMERVMDGGRPVSYTHLTLPTTSRV